MTSARLYGIAARVMALATSGWTAAIVLWSPTSVAARMAGDSAAVYAINGATLACCSLGLLDILWHDIRGKLVWPTFPMQYRHRVCVMLYSMLAGLTGLRAFVAAASDYTNILLLGGYYLMCAMGIGIVAVAVALEPRNVEK